MVDSVDEPKYTFLSEYVDALKKIEKGLFKEVEKTEKEEDKE